MKARVTVTLKNGVLDPQGKAIEGALKSLGIDGVARCARARSSTSSRKHRRPRPKPAQAACEKLLANTVIENYRVEIALRRHESRRHPLPRLQSRRRRGARRSAQCRPEPQMSGMPRRELPAGTDLVVLPGGFAYGDYLRCGAIAGRARRSWMRSALMRRAAAMCSASATASRSSARRGFSPAC